MLGRSHFQIFVMVLVCTLEQLQCMVEIVNVNIYAINGVDKKLEDSDFLLFQVPLLSIFSSTGETAETRIR